MDITKSFNDFLDQMKSVAEYIDTEEDLYTAMHTIIESMVKYQIEDIDFIKFYYTYMYYTLVQRGGHEQFFEVTNGFTESVLGVVLDSIPTTANTIISLVFLSIAYTQKESLANDGILVEEHPDLVEVVTLYEEAMSDHDNQFNTEIKPVIEQWCKETAYALIDKYFPGWGWQMIKTMLL